MTKYQQIDPGSISDIANASEETKQFHEMKARQEAQAIVSKYKGTPTYLKLLSMHLAGQAGEVYSAHMRELEAQNPENQQYERMKREITEQVHRELGLLGEND